MARIVKAGRRSRDARREIYGSGVRDPEFPPGTLSLRITCLLPIIQEAILHLGKFVFPQTWNLPLKTSRDTGWLGIRFLLWHLYSPLSWNVACTMSKIGVFTASMVLLWVHFVELTSKERFPLHVRVTFSPLNILFQGGFKDTTDFQAALRRSSCEKRYRGGNIIGNCLGFKIQIY